MPDRRTRYCPDCRADMPPDWGMSWCKHCGATLEILDEADGVPMWDGTEDLSAWTKKPFDPSKRLVPESRDFAFDRRGGEVVLSSAPPAALLLLGIATLGVSTVVWIVRRIAMLNGAVSHAERLRIGPFQTWMLMQTAAYISLAAGIASARTGALASIGGAATLFGLAGLYFAISFVMSRYYLFWIRDAVDEALGGDAVGGRGYLPLWYLGAAYLQMHIDRATAKRSRGKG